MILICAETGEEIETETSVLFYAAIAAGMAKPLPLSRSAVAMIPPELWRADLSEDDGINLHGGVTQDEALKLGDFLFSISRETAECFAPNFLKLCAISRAIAPNRFGYLKIPRHKLDC